MFRFRAASSASTAVKPGIAEVIGNGTPELTTTTASTASTILSESTATPLTRYSTQVFPSSTSSPLTDKKEHLKTPSADSFPSIFGGAKVMSPTFFDIPVNSSFSKFSLLLDVIIRLGSLGSPQPANSPSNPMTSTTNTVAILNRIEKSRKLSNASGSGEVDGIIRDEWQLLSEWIIKGFERLDWKLDKDTPGGIPIDQATDLARRSIYARSHQAIQKDIWHLLHVATQRLDIRLTASRTENLLENLQWLWLKFHDILLPGLECVFLPLRTALVVRRTTTPAPTFKDTTAANTIAAIAAAVSRNNSASSLKRPSKPLEDPSFSSWNIRNLACAAFRDQVVMPRLDVIKGKNSPLLELIPTGLDLLSRINLSEPETGGGELGRMLGVMVQLVGMLRAPYVTSNPEKRQRLASLWQTIILKWRPLMDASADPRRWKYHKVRAKPPPSVNGVATSMANKRMALLMVNDAVTNFEE